MRSQSFSQALVKARRQKKLPDLVFKRGLVSKERQDFDLTITLAVDRLAVTDVNLF